MVLDFSDWVWDVDNYKSQLTLISYSEYCNANGMKVSFSFPANVTSYTFAFGVNDGTNVSRGSVQVFISDSLQPPTIDDMDDVVVNEDTLLVIDLVANLSDPDTPKTQLTLVSQSVNVTVDGLSIHLLYTKGGFQETVVIQVHDGIWWDETSFEVTVVEVNDEPVIAEIPIVNISEDEETVVDLDLYVSDEETLSHLLVIECMHDYLVDQSGKTLLFLYPDPVEDHVVYFYVSDGTHRKRGAFTVHVIEVNDVPRILSIGGHRPPVTLNLTSDKQRSYFIEAVDSDDDGLSFRVEASWDGIRVNEDFLTLMAFEAGHGAHTAHVVATDPRGGFHRLPITFQVLPFDDLPVSIVFDSPLNHSTVPAASVLEIDIRLDDQYKLLQYPIRVDFSSDRDGDLGHIYVEGSGTLWAGSLSDGHHRITAELTDGNRPVTGWMELQVGEVAEPVGTEDYSWLYIVIVIIIILIIIAAVFMSSGASSTQRDTRAFGEVVRQAEMVERAEQAKAVKGDDRDARILRERERDERARVAREVAVTVGSDTDHEATTRSPFKPSAPRPPTPTPRSTTASRQATRGGPGLALPTDQELEAKLPVIKAAIEALPRGVPSDLSLFDPATIAKRIVKGRRKWSESGQLVSFLQGEWYYADPTDLTTFLKHYEE